MNRLLIDTIARRWPWTAAGCIAYAAILMDNAVHATALRGLVLIPALAIVASNVMGVAGGSVRFIRSLPVTIRQIALAAWASTVGAPALFLGLTGAAAYLASRLLRMAPLSARDCLVAWLGNTALIALFYLASGHRKPETSVTHSFAAVLFMILAPVFAPPQWFSLAILAPAALASAAMSGFAASRIGKRFVTIADRERPGSGRLAGIQFSPGGGGGPAGLVVWVFAQTTLSVLGSAILFLGVFGVLTFLGPLHGHGLDRVQPSIVETGLVVLYLAAFRLNGVDSNLRSLRFLPMSSWTLSAILVLCPLISIAICRLLVVIAAALIFREPAPGYVAAHGMVHMAPLACIALYPVAGLRGKAAVWPVLAFVLPFQLYIVERSTIDAFCSGSVWVLVAVAAIAVSFVATALSIELASSVYAARPARA